MSLLDRYVIGQYLRLLPMCVIAAAGSFVVVDFFLRIDEFAEHGAEASAIVSYVLFKLPRVITEVFPAASLIAVLVGIGLLAERRELVAMQACGVGRKQVLWPLVIAGTLLSVAVLTWNEAVVPPTSSRARAIQDINIENKAARGALNASSLWFQNPAGFVNVDYFDANQNVLYGITVLDMDDAFRLRGVIEVPQAFWSGHDWQLPSGTVTTFGPEAEATSRDLVPGDLEILEKPSDFRRKRRRSYEFSYAELSQRIARLREKGLDAKEYIVDLHFKIASPFAGLVAILIGLPLAVRGGGRRGSTLLSNVALGLGVCFVYWSATAIAVSAGHTGTIPPLAAAWGPNLAFSLVGMGVYLAAEG